MRQARSKDLYEIKAPGPVVGIPVPVEHAALRLASTVQQNLSATKKIREPRVRVCPGYSDGGIEA